MDVAFGRVGHGPSYDALSLDEDSIRLIDFKNPATSNGAGGQSPPLECSVKVYSFSARTTNYEDLTLNGNDSDEMYLQKLAAWESPIQSFPYRYHWGDWLAFSHCWGDQEATEVIIVNDETCKISANMSAGLRAISQLAAVRKGKLKLWNDFLCLDQQNKKEIEQELKRVPRIYANSFVVVAWIGPADYQSGLVMDLLRKKLHGSDGDCYSADHILKSLNRDEWKALVSLLQRDYWRRMWITQELTLAGSRTMMLCGSDMAPLTRMWVLIKAIIRNVALGHRLLADALGTGDSYYDPVRHQTFSVIARLLYLHDIDEMRRRTFAASEYDFLPLLDVCRYSEQRYLRDKVYGVLGLLPPSVTRLIEPDLNKAPHEVCTDLVVASIQASDRLDIIQNCMYNAANPVYPTWTPDLSVNDMSHSLGTRVIINAGGDLLEQPRISADRHILHCRGILLDEIGHLTPPQWPLDPISPQQSADGVPRSTRATPPPSHEAIKESLWRVLVGGTAGFPHDRSPPPEYSQLLDLPWPPSHDTLLPEDIAQDLINANWCTLDEKQDMVTYVTFRQRAGRSFDLAGHNLGSFSPSSFSPSSFSPSSFSPSASSPAATSSHTPSPIPQPTKPKWHNRAMLRQACNTLKRRRLFVTAFNRLGVCGRQARPGDILAILRGCSAPLILRRQNLLDQPSSPTSIPAARMHDGKGEIPSVDDAGSQQQNAERYVVVGACYVDGDGIMQGEWLGRHAGEERDVVLV